MSQALKRWWPKLWQAAISALVGFSLFSQSGQTVHNCQQIELIKTRIRNIVQQSASSLGQPGSAGYSYYLAHPGELAQARRDNAATLDAFRASRC